MKQIPPDKLMHLVAGGVAAAVGAVVLARSGAPFPAAWAAAGTAAVAGLLREAYNLTRGGPWSWPDVAATVAGAVPVVAVLVAG